MTPRLILTATAGCVLMGLITGLAGFHNVLVIAALGLLINACITVAYIEGVRVAERRAAVRINAMIGLSNGAA